MQLVFNCICWLQLTTSQASYRYMRSAPLLSLESVTKYYGDLPVLQQVALELQAGERVALTGPSGSGKSTLLNCILGIEAIDQGSIALRELLCMVCPIKQGIVCGVSKWALFFKNFICCRH